MSVQIKNIEGLTVQQVRDMVHQGGKFVLFPYTISIVLMTFKRSSDVYFVKPGESSFKHGAGFIFLNLIMGWWGIPWGPVYTIGSLASHIGGGKNVTAEVLGMLNQQSPIQEQSGYNVPGANNNSSQGAQDYHVGSQGYNVTGANANSTNSGSAYNIPR
jgi:hypothetical protein